jgi:hypothetical protein
MSPVFDRRKGNIRDGHNEKTRLFVCGDRRMAAKEVKGLIGESVKRVGAGSKLVGEASSTIVEIVHSVKRVSDIVSEIASASQEQSKSGRTK